MINAQNNSSYALLIEVSRPLRFNSIGLAGNLKECLFLCRDAIRQTVVLTREFNIVDRRFIQLFAMSAPSNHPVRNISGILFHAFGRERNSNRLVAPSNALTPAVFRQLQWSEYLARSLYSFTPPRFFLSQRPRWSSTQLREINRGHMQELTPLPSSLVWHPPLFPEPGWIIERDDSYGIPSYRISYPSHRRDEEPLALREWVRITVCTILVVVVAIAVVAAIYSESCQWNNFFKYQSDEMFRLQMQHLRIQESIKNIQFKHITY